MPPESTTESPSTVHGRLMEAVHLAGYSSSRATLELEWLLDENRWEQLGFPDFNAFVRSLRMDEFRFAIEQRKGLVQRLHAMEASNRSIATALGVSDETVARDLGHRATNVASEVEAQIQEQPAAATNVAPAIPDHSPQKIAQAIYDALGKDGVRDALGAHVGNNSGEYEWYTPSEYIDAARATMGAIDLDPASHEVANEIVKATTFYTLEDNGLERDWFGRVWMNPPYAQPAITQFCERLRVFLEAGLVTEACVLTNNGTETFWGQTLLGSAALVCYPSARIKFWNPEKDSASPLQGQMITYFGPNADVFKAEFSRFGVVR